jgi:hypothetical protein
MYGYSGGPGEGEALRGQEVVWAYANKSGGPASAEEDLAQRVTEDTGYDGDPHAHNERKAEEMATEMTEDTGAGGDMNLDAERRVDQTGNRMFED